MDINYELQLKKFWQVTNTVKLSSNAQCLYFQLLNLFNNNFWCKELKINNLELQRLSGLSRHQITNARIELQKYSLVKFTNGTGSAPCTYSMIDITNLNKLSIIPNYLFNENLAKIDNLERISKEYRGKLNGTTLIYFDLIIKTLQKAITDNKQGKYGNFYTTTQMFLNCEYTVTFDLINKLISVLSCKEVTIHDKEAYILTTIANEMRKRFKNPIELKKVQNAMWKQLNKFNYKK